MIAKLIPYRNITNDIKRHQYKRYGKRSLSQIEKIIVHHSGTKNGTAAAYARYHVNKLYWPGMGYGMVADRNGINQTNDLSTISYHCSGQNTKSVGICQTGNFDLREPTDEEYLNWIRMILIIDSKLDRQVPVKYHNEYSSKSCPGKLFNKAKFEKELQEFRWLLS